MGIGRIETEAELETFVLERLNQVLPPLRALAGRIHIGQGDPNGVVTAPIGHIYVDELGGAGATLWVKETGTGASGWNPK